MSKYTLPKIKVKDIMKKDVVTVNKDDTIEKLIDIIKKFKYHGYPVIDKRSKEVVGIVTKSDVIKIFERKTLSKFFATHVEDVMDHYPRIISPETDLEEAVEILMKEKFRALPVVKNKKLVGLISKTDIIKQIVKDEKI